ncbi:hypothetical protein D0T50_12770 [Bacteroides sp. 214]|uniref:sensor histidine kinase n=1 Tax=Bacteroides sp. 214 TaxID=2302935 RepID=UPI0013D33308|nr:ATP-binding protein [Bacteroides sp. 214]NDW13756.1 hypothetical protein [Bacteroides sp. 214]
MRVKLIIGILLALLTGGVAGACIVYFIYESKPLWILPGLLIIPVTIYLFLEKKLIKPYQLIVSGMKLLNEQDFSTRLRPVANKEANQMIAVFNRMIATLRQERLQVREKNHFLDLLIEASSQGIIILDFDERVSDVNASGVRLLGISSVEQVRGKRLSETGVALATSLAALDNDSETVVRTSGVNIYRCVRSSFVDQGFEHPFILIEELTSELLKIEKESYERIIRMMSHEVNNSVGAIGSTLNVISDIFKQDDVNGWDDVLPAVEVSHDRCGNLAKFISNFAHVVKIPAPTLSDVSLNEQARAVDALTRSACGERNIILTLTLASEDKIIRIDGIQMEQVLVNIIKNAYESIGCNGEIKITTYNNPPSILIEDNGPGIPEEVREKLFTPFFTTKPAGQGIGLMFVRDVLLNHGCRFSLETENGWTRFGIWY